MEFAFVSPLNVTFNLNKKRKQILLDWINTIDEPKCLLAGNLNDLKDGEVFLEIMLHYLKIQKRDEFFMEEFRQVESLNIPEKFDFIIKILKIISNDNENFNFFSYEDILKSEDFLLDFTYLIKRIYSKTKESKVEENKDYSYEEEGKSNNLFDKDLRHKELINNKKDKNEKENIINFKDEFIMNLNHDSYSNISYNYDGNISRPSKNKNSNIDSTRSFNQKLNNDFKNNDINNASDNYYNNSKNRYIEKYINTDSQKSSNITSYNEISNDYIQSTCANNQFLVNTNDLDQSKKLNFKNILHNNNNDCYSNISYENMYKNIIYQSFNQTNSGMMRDMDLKIDKTIHLSINPNSANKVAEITNPNSINLINKNSKMKNNKSEKSESKKLSAYERELLEEMNSSNKIGIKYDHKKNSLKRNNEKLRNEENSKNCLIYTKQIESRAQSKCEIKKTNYISGTSRLRENKAHLKDNLKSNSTFNSDKSNDKESTNFYRIKLKKNNIDNEFNQNDYINHDKTNDLSERKIKKIQPIKIERKDIYTSSELDQLNMLMGFPNKNKMEINNQKIEYFFFHKLTNPIKNIEFEQFQKSKYINNLNIINERFVNISYEDQINKYHQENKFSIHENNYSKIDEDFKKLKHKNSVTNKGSKSPSKINISRQPSINDPEGLNLLNKNHIISYSNYSKNLETNPKINKSSNDDFDMGGKSSKYITNKLLNWLISLNMIKEGTVKAIDIPRMCANGVFLSDLINRLEGRLESIKGIIRKTTSRSHIQINVNKLLDYLRSLEKFNPRNLWSNNEICAGDPKTVFELLDDIWSFYSNKVSFDKPNRGKSKFRDNSLSSVNINNSDYKAIKNNIDNKDYSNSKNFINKDHQIIENSINSISLNPNNSKKKSIKEIDKRKEIIVFSPISKHDEDKESKNMYQNTNSDILKFLNGDNDNRLYTKPFIKREKSETKLGLPPRNKNESKENITNGPNFINNKSSITQRNRNVIADCLGLESSKKLRKDKKINSYSTHCLHNKTEINKTINRETQRNNLNDVDFYLKDKLNQNKYFNENERGKSMGSIRQKSNENKCFIIFNKSNIKNLKKEMRRYDSKNGTIETESLNSSIIDDRRKYIVKHNKEIKEKNKFTYKEHQNFSLNYDINPTAFENGDKNDFGNTEINSKNRYLLSSPLRDEKIKELEESDVKNKYSYKYVINLAESKTKIEKDDILIREWLDSLGCKNTFLIDLTKEESSEFRDGLILNEIVSILENKKIHGINPNPKSVNACTLNISKNMPYDYLWSDDEIYKGNQQTIIELLKQIKKAYHKESEYIIKNKNH